MIVKRKISIRLTAAYILLLFVTAATRDFGITPLVTREWGPVAAAFVEPTWKLLFWILPALLYIAAFYTGNVLSYLRLTSNIKKGIIWGVVGSLPCCIRVLPLLIAKHTLHFAHSFDDWLNVVLLVGLIEEIVFRGFLFQHVQSLFNGIGVGVGAQWDQPLLPIVLKDESVDLSSWMPSRRMFWASTVSTCVFALAHFPLWMYQHQPPLAMLSGTIFNVLLGYYLCFILRSSQSLWACILIHMCNNLVVTLTLP